MKFRNTKGNSFYAKSGKFISLVHEWLWRNNLEEENERKADVETIYTSTNKTEIQELLNKYHVDYIFIGSCEYEKYGEINMEFLKSFGETVFKEKKTVIIKLI